MADIYEDVLVHEEYIGTEGPCRGYTDHIKMGQNRYILTCIRYYDNYAFTEFSSDWSFANMASSRKQESLYRTDRHLSPQRPLYAPDRKDNRIYQ